MTLMSFSSLYKSEMMWRDSEILISVELSGTHKGFMKIVVLKIRRKMRATCSLFQAHYS